MVLGTLTALSLRPIGVIEELVERLIAPARLVAEVAAPVRWWSQREARAAEESLKQSEAELVAEAKELLEEERLAARPPDHLVPAGLRIVHAEVIERRDGEEDSLIVRWSDTTELELGIPVVVGEHYIGRLAKLEPERGRGVVDLITGKDFFGGARLSDSERGSGELVVGGLAPRSEGAALSLAVHNPRVGEMRSGSVRVREWLEGDGFGSWGDGFLLGDFDVEEAEGEVVNERSWWTGSEGDRKLRWVTEREVGGGGKVEVEGRGRRRWRAQYTHIYTNKKTKTTISRHNNI